MAPPARDIPTFPGLAVDSFVTYGLKADPGDDRTSVPKLDWTDDMLQTDTPWFIPPDNLQGHVGHFDNGPNTVLIAQFSIAAGAAPDAGIVGTLLIQGVNDGAGFQSVHSFERFVPAPGAMAVLGAAAILARRRRRVRERRLPCAHAP